MSDEIKYPEIYLAIDNCFAFKRWTLPEEWAKVIKDLGVDYIEASADTELDPLFMGPDYLEKWVLDVKAAEKEFDVKIANLYSGHGTYCTLGLTHTDPQVRRRMIDSWFKPLIRAAAALNAGLGFFAHAFSERVLEDRQLYAEYMTYLYDGLSELNEFAGEEGCGKIGVEQMYSPHQVPWRIEDVRQLLKTVKKKSGYSFYFTEDLGHHQLRFVKPDESVIKTALRKKSAEGLWLGSRKAYRIFDSVLDNKAGIEELYNEIKSNPHLFAEITDGDCYAWLGRLGCYSPIIHLQQTNGRQSAHLHFTDANNKTGIVDGKKVLDALMQSYRQPSEDGMPERCDKIYLTLEVFTGTASINTDIINHYRESVRYWRRFIPEDGITLDRLVQDCV